MTRRVGTYEVVTVEGDRWAVPIEGARPWLAARGGRIVGFCPDLPDLATPTLLRELQREPEPAPRRRRKRGSSK